MASAFSAPIRGAERPGSMVVWADGCAAGRVEVALSRGFAPGAGHAAGRSGRLSAVALQRVAWLVTVLGFLVAAVVLLLSDYNGYAALSAAVALSASINLR